MKFEITDFAGRQVVVQPRIELYTVRDFMGKELPGLAVVLDEVGEGPEMLGQYATLTLSFGEFISIKNSAYIDVNNCPFAEQLLSQGVAAQTGFTKTSGFCTYPLWVFQEEFLREAGGENYEKYSRAYDEYYRT